MRQYDMIITLVRVLKVLKPQNRRNLKRDYLNFKKRIWQNPSYFKQKQTG